MKSSCKNQVTSVWPCHCTSVHALLCDCLWVMTGFPARLLPRLAAATWSPRVYLWTNRKLHSTLTSMLRIGPIWVVHMNSQCNSFFNSHYPLIEGVVQIVDLRSTHKCWEPQINYCWYDSTKKSSILINVASKLCGTAQLKSECIQTLLTSSSLQDSSLALHCRTPH